MPTVSVIIPVYNTSKWLDRCLESVRRQRLGDLEILCVDDGSRDDSAERLTALARQDGRIRVLHQRNKGLSEARNIGLRETSAGLVYFLDSDDFIHEQLLELAVGALEGNPRAAFALVDYLKVASDACPSEATIVYPEGEPPPTRTMANPLREFLKDNESPDVWRFVYRREALGALRFVPGCATRIWTSPTASCGASPRASGSMPRSTSTCKRRTPCCVTRSRRTTPVFMSGSCGICAMISPRCRVRGACCGGASTRES